MSKVYDESQMNAAPPNKGKGSPIPNDVKGFNWGVFWITPIWSIVNKSWIPLIVWLVITAIAQFIPWFKIVAIIFCIALGFFGNQWAWQNKDWKSIAEFHRVQRLWAIWSTVWGILRLTVLAILLLVTIFGMNKYVSNSICNIDKISLETAFRDKSFDNSEAMAKAAFEYQQELERKSEEYRKNGYRLEPVSNSKPASNSEPLGKTMITLKGSTVTTTLSTQKFISKGNCAPNSKKCGVYIYTKELRTGKDTLACKYYIENGGKLTEIPLKTKGKK